MMISLIMGKANNILLDSEILKKNIVWTFWMNFKDAGSVESTVIIIVFQKEKIIWQTRRE